MTDIFYMGGPLFMGILTLLLLVVLVLTVYRAVQLLNGTIEHHTTFRHQLTHIKSVGLFAMIVGIFAQLIGLYDAFSAIERVGDVSPALLAGGLRVSMVTTIYGIVIFLVAYLAWMVLDITLKSTAGNEGT